ncbi:MAG TPA: Uma2 family endonuclease [Tepidisphaeraceae bacterium]|jgi:Uma2 family endonuclease|nr:Uma2 family endonuclease [Tepidisphaeraceae bacterium]
MSDAGIFDVLGRKRTELIDGRIVRMAPQKSRHMSSISAIARLLIESTTRKDDVVIQGTLYLPDCNSAPEPDFHLFDVPRQTPLHAKPKPFLVIEVSDQTYRRDSGSKLRVYAQAGIEDYWIVNLQLQRVEIYRDPVAVSGHEKDWRYAAVTYREIGQNVMSLRRPEISFPVADMLP